MEKMKRKIRRQDNKTSQYLQNQGQEKKKEREKITGYETLFFPTFNTTLTSLLSFAVQVLKSKNSFNVKKNSNATTTVLAL